MPQYGIFVYSPAPADPMEISEEYLAGLEAYPATKDGGVEVRPLFEPPAE